MKALVFYSTEHCTLCDEALDLLLSMPELSGRSVHVVDVSIEDALQDRYGARLPVLSIEGTGAELGWPFSKAEVLAWIRNIE